MKIIRKGAPTDAERKTAALLLAEGEPRWIVGARLGRFPLAFQGSGRDPAERRRSYGGNLSAEAARADSRQIDMDYLFGDFADADPE